MEGATFSPERSQPNDQKSEGISINAITTAPDQLSPRESINGGEVAAFPDSGKYINHCICKINVNIFQKIGK